MKLLPICIPFFLSLYTNAQDTVTHLNEVVISGFRESELQQTSLHLEAYSLKKLDRTVPFNLSDALSRIPGVGQMNTGNAISKPVIRGMYGNRVLVLFSGLRFDNQQFQDEHGLGLSQIGIDKIELIKGPASAIYGTDAVGGVINIIEEKGTPVPGNSLEVNTRIYSNTRGTLTDVAYKHTGSKANWWRMRAGIENHSDYSSGGNARVLNSRNKGYYFKAGIGFDRKKWSMDNSYNFSYNQYGFIMKDLTSFFDADARNSRSMAGPHHNVMLHILSSQNTFRLKSSTLMVNAGVQSNRRAEDEGGGAISLNMHLLSLLENAKWQKKLNKNIELVVNQQSTYEVNTNLGKRILVPDASMLENNLSVYGRFFISKLVAELGMGYINKRIETFTTGQLNVGNPNTPDISLRPFKNSRSTFNGVLGLAYNPANGFCIKTNVSTGTRSANLAELSSNGLHEGVYRCEIGDPTLKAEQNVNTDLTIELEKKKLFISASAYYNQFHNYIYLTPTNENWNAFPVFRYVQKDAAIYGGELIAIGKPTRFLQIKQTFSVTEGILQKLTAFDSSGYLPFIPPPKSLTSIRFETPDKHNAAFYAEPELEYVFTQNKPALFETNTSAYALVNVFFGYNGELSSNDFDLKLAVRNLLDRSYADHLSRLKYYGLNNQGINIVLSFSLKLNNL